MFLFSSGMRIGAFVSLLSPETGKIDPSAVSIGEHRSTLARRNIKAWIESRGLPYHSPHKFRHGHVQYGLAQSKSIADYKAISLNVLHSSMEITDEFYSNLKDGEVQNRINSLGKGYSEKSDNQQAVKLLKEVVARLEKEA